jgi:hypothetical protein
MFPPLGTSIPVTPPSPLLCRPCVPHYPDFLPRSMDLPFYPARVCNLRKRSHILYARVSFVTFSPTRKVPWTNDRQGVEIMGVISQRHGRHA